MASDYDLIRQENVRAYGAEVRHLDLLAHLYTDRTHFVFELLQNAEDAGARRVDFVLFGDRLEVQHDGRLFNDHDVRGICGVAEGSKDGDLTKIGRFGVGFKSVYSFTSNPEIHSGDEHFSIEHYVRPCAAPPRTPAGAYTTLFVYPFTHQDVRADDAFAQIAHRLLHLDARTLLFLHHIVEITWRVEGGRSGTYLRQASPHYTGRKVQLLGQTEGESEQDETWLVFARPVLAAEHTAAVAVEVAFLLAPAGTDHVETITPIDESPLVVYFPTAKETNLGFLVQGPYRTTPARDNIPSDDPWNESLVGETATLLVETLPVLRDLGLLSLGLLKALPTKPDDFRPGTLCRPLFELVRTALQQQPLLPTANGEYHDARQIRLGRSGVLRELLSDHQLGQLYATGFELYWLPDEITIDREPTLHAYLRSELKIEELTAEGFGTRLTLPFLAAQSDEWMAQFYMALRTMRALWQASQSLSRAVLRSRPILRLEDGRHIEPFGKDGTPAAYLPTAQSSQFPTVKRSIAAFPEALESLRLLGLTEPDVIAELRELILPRYNSEGGTVDRPQYLADLRSMSAALRIDSRYKRQEVVKMLRAVPWVAAQNAADGHQERREPSETYMPTAALTLYFQDNAEVWFMVSDESIQQAFSEAEWRELGVAYSPRLLRFQPTFSPPERAALRGNQPSTRDVQIDDYLLEGLTHVLDNYALVRADEAASLARNIWQWMGERLDAPQPVERQRGFDGVYTWIYYYRRSATFAACWIKELRAHAWLPGANGTVHRPEDITFDDLPADFARDQRLARILDLGSAVRVGAEKLATLAAEIGVSVAHLEFLRQHRAQIEALMRKQDCDAAPQTHLSVASSAAFGARIQQLFSRGAMAHEQLELFEPDTVPHLERRRERTQREIALTQAREPEIAERFSRVPQPQRAAKDNLVRQFLLEQYHGRCQLCGDGFLKQDGIPYFEGLYLVPHIAGAWLERPGNVLCLCATCCAKMQFGAIETDGNDLLTQVAGIRLRAEGGDEQPQIHLRVCGVPAVLTFSERHILDLQEMLKPQPHGAGKDGAA